MAGITGATSLYNTTTNLDNTPGGTWLSSNTAVATINSSGIVNGIVAGTTVISYTIPADVNGCSNSVSATITVDPAATANAGTLSGICQSSSPVAIPLSGSSVGGAAITGAWSVISGGGSLSSTLQTVNPAAVTYTPAANFSGTVTLLLTTNSPGSCGAVTSTTILTISQVPIVNAGSSVTVCQSTSPLAIVLSGTMLGGGASTAAWSIISGGGTLSSTAQTANPETVTYTPVANYSGPVSLQLLTNVSGTCSAASANKSITINALPLANGGTPNPLVVCKASSAMTLSGAGYSGGATTAAWSITSAGGGTLSSISQTASPASVTYTPAATFTGTITLTLTSNALPGCSPATATRNIIITVPSISIAGGPGAICQSATPLATLLTGASVGGGATTGAWSIISGGGTLSSTTQTTSPSAITFTPAPGYSGTVTLRLPLMRRCPAVFYGTIRFLARKLLPEQQLLRHAQTASGSARGISPDHFDQHQCGCGSTRERGHSQPTSLTTFTSTADKSAGVVTLTLTALKFTLRKCYFY
ncbi:MAG: hypothetical protein WKI04_04865 [Ferruginibacter sp.]